MKWENLLSTRRLGDTTELPVAPDEERTDFERDYDRVVFSSAFRKLQDKTQVIPMPKQDFVHSRLTHSLEVSCVGRSLGKIAGNHILEKYPELSSDLGITSSNFGAIVAAASLAHDIGNPPFGHSGEKAISEYFINGKGKRFRTYVGDDKKWEDLTNFEGNANGFRILTNSSNSVRGGIGLTCATLAAFTKYPKESLPSFKKPERASEKKFGIFQSEKELYKEVADALELKVNRNEGGTSWIRHPLAFLMEAADDICYSIIDFEDGLRLGLLPDHLAEELLTPVIGEGFDSKRLKTIPDRNEQYAYLRAKAISSLVIDLSEIFIRNEKDILNGSYDRSLLKDSTLLSAVENIKEISFQKVYRSKNVLEIEAAGFEVLGGLLEFFISAIVEKDQSYHNKHLLNLVPKQYIQQDDDSYLQIMRICEFVAGMTDSYAISFYRKLKGIELPNE